MKHEFTAVFERGDGDWWIATALEISGGFTQSKTIDEAREMLAEREQAEVELVGKSNLIRETLILEIE